MLEFIEGSFDDIPLFIESLSVSALHLSVTLGRDNGFCPHFSSDKTHNGVAIVSLVGQHGFGFLPLKQGNGLCAICFLTAGKFDPHRLSFAVGQQMDFGGQSSTASPHSRVFFALRPVADN